MATKRVLLISALAVSVSARASAFATPGSHVNQASNGVASMQRVVASAR